MRSSMSNKFLHTFVYNTPARKRSIMFRVSLTSDSGYEVIAHSINNRVQTTIDRRRASDLKDALQTISELAKPYEKKKYEISASQPTPWEILATMDTPAASAAEATAQPIVALTTLVARTPSQFIGGGEMVPVLL